MQLLSIMMSSICVTFVCGWLVWWCSRVATTTRRRNIISGGFFWLAFCMALAVCFVVLLLLDRRPEGKLGLPLNFFEIQGLWIRPSDGGSSNSMRKTQLWGLWWAPQKSSLCTKPWWCVDRVLNKIDNCCGVFCTPCARSQLEKNNSDLMHSLGFLWLSFSLPILLSNISRLGVSFKALLIRMLCLMLC